MNTATWGNAQMGGYTTVEMLLDDVSRQMAINSPVRFSRTSHGPRPANSMRVVKPSSASNSPRGSAGLGRRQTVMNDGAYRRRLAMLAGGMASNDGLQIPFQARASRPMSWHPASQNTPPQAYQSYAAPSTEMYRNYQPYDVASAPSVYSGYGSPDSTFSPLSMPYVSNDQVQYHSHPSVQMSTNQFVQQQYHYLPHENSNLAPQAMPSTDPSMFSHFEWNNFATNGFENSSTTPPTPENYLPVQHPETMFPAEDAIPYHSLEESNSDDGEELIGMGLYDTPEMSKSSSADPQLDNYRAFMMSSMLGSGYAAPRRMESTGKGLKLEETWTPPSDDEDEEEEDDDDDEQDGEGEDEEEPEVVSQSGNFIHYQQECLPTQRSYGTHVDHQAYTRDGWL